MDISWSCHQNFTM